MGGAGGRVAPGAAGRWRRSAGRPGGADVALRALCFLVQTHLTFGHDFTQAVEQKQVAQQDAEKARYVVEKVSVWRRCPPPPRCRDSVWRRCVS